LAGAPETDEAPMPTTAIQRRPLCERAADIARMLGKGWSVSTPPCEEDQNAAQLAGPDGYGIYLEINQYNHKGRMVISGIYPHDERGTSYALYEEVPVITVAEARPVGQIVKEIATRFLPPYKQVFAQAQARKQATEERIARERELINRLAPIVGATAPQHDPNAATCSIPGTRISVTITTHYGECGLKLEKLPDEAAARILEILAEYRAE